MEPATWETCRADFAFDGALIDLQVPNSGQAEWDMFWSALRVGPFKLFGYRDGEPHQLPETLAEILVECEVAAVMVSVQSGGITANVHFGFAGGELELDIDPREVVNESAFEAVLAVMKFVAAAVRLAVYATAEGGSVLYAFLRVTPDGQAVLLPEGSVRRD
jgi:hypothetical protein